MKTSLSTKLSILIVTSPFPNANEVFSDLKILSLARKGHRVYVLSKFPGEKTKLKKIRASEPNLDIRPFSTLKFRGSKINFFYRLFLLPFKIVKAVIVSPNSTYRTIKTIFLDGFNRNQIYRLFMQLDLIFLSRKVQIIHFDWNNQAKDYLEALINIITPFLVSIRGKGISSQPLVDDELARKLPILFNRANYIHSVSHGLVEHGIAFGVKQKKVVVITDAIDLPQFTPPKIRNYSQRPIQIITVAHLVWKKNILGAVLAIKILVDRGYDVTYIIVGEGPERENLTFAIRDLGLNNRVFLRGRISHESVIHSLSKSHIFLMPSVQEGFCISVIEAQAMELPVVVTDAEGLQENIEENVTGLVAKRWDVKDLADKMEILLQNPDKCSSFGKAGRIRAIEHFGIDQQIKKFENLYSHIIEKNES